MHYEVFIPSTDPDGFDTTITVEASNWMVALKSGLERIGEGSDIMQNVMCDIKSDNSIHVTDATSRRVFVLREISEETADDDDSNFDTIRTDPVAPAPAAAQIVQPPAPISLPKPGLPKSQPAPATAAAVHAPQAPAATVAAPAPAPQAQAAQQSVATATATATAPAPQAPAPATAPDANRLRVGSSSQQALRSEDDEEPRVLKETRQKTGENKAMSFSRAEEKVSETLIEDVFLEIQDIHENNMSMEDVINFVMDMAVDKINAESGSILLADVNGKELYFATARGPKANEIMSFRVPMGQGLAGFCAREGVSLAISDAQRDPRFYKEISQALGYETRSLLCVPIQQEGQIYGVIEVINKKSASNFSSDETNALAYIGRQLARYIFEVVISGARN